MGVRGATWKHEFLLPFSMDLIKDLEIAYAQDGKVILTKRLADCKIVNGEIHLELTPQETFLFEGDKTAQVQMRILDPIYNEPNSQPLDFVVYPSLFEKPMREDD